MEDILLKYLELPEYLAERAQAPILLECHHSNGRRIARCKECEEENRIFSGEREDEENHEFSLRGYYSEDYRSRCALCGWKNCQCGSF